jgi:RND family efflux transporter MFP subunit
MLLCSSVIALTAMAKLRRHGRRRPAPNLGWRHTGHRKGAIVRMTDLARPSRTRTTRKRAAAMLGRGLLLALLATAAACEPSAPGDQAAAAPPPPPVTVATPLQKKITEWYEFTGRFEATERVDVRARVAGYVQAIDFQDGELVEQGQALFVIDPRPYQARVDQATAQLESVKARVALADAELARAGELVERANVSRSTYDQRVQEKQAAEAAVKLAEAALQEANLDLGFTTVRAPISGRISDRRVDLGNLVAGDPSATLLTTIVALDPIYFVFDMSEADFLAYQRAVARGALPAARDGGTQVQLRLPDEPDGETWPRHGQMNFVDNQIEAGAGTIRSRAVLANADQFILPGQFGRLRLPGSPEYEALLIPDEAIITDQANKLVMTVGADNTVQPRPIRPGPSYAYGLRIVREGLKPEDQLVINGLMRVRPGAKVTPEPGKIEAAAPAASTLAEQ